MKKFIIAIPLLAVLSACAQSPAAIAPIPMGTVYDGMSCAAASQALTREQANLAALSTQQNNAVTGDAIGVFLIGVPVSSLSGNDVAGAIGVSKGRIVAFQNRLAVC